jgi:hypothetical protein
MPPTPSTTTTCPSTSPARETLWTAIDIGWHSAASSIVRPVPDTERQF